MIFLCGSNSYSSELEKVRLTVVKNRSGKTGEVELTFNKKTGLFQDE
ncbi:hypothetical protein ACWNYH_00525 [Candidatus Vidania fulgoroideorum]